MEKKLSALQGIRACACIGIFLFHSGFLPKGTFPVTLFFVLSGFLIYYNEHNLEKYPDYQVWIKKYTWKKLKNFWPLHAITFAASLFIGNVFAKLSVKMVVSGILNLFLVQTWYQPFALDFNGLSWYLSCAVFLYFIAYFGIKFVNRSKHSFFSVAICAGLIICINMLSYWYPLYTYSNPLYRMLEFMIGMLWARVFLDKAADSRIGTSGEIIAVLITAVYYLATVFFKEIPGLWTIILSCDVYVFAGSDGIISKFLSLPFFNKIAYYSFEFYMIHELVLRVFRKVFPEVSYPNYLVRIIIIAVPSLIISGILAVLYKKLFTKAIKKS